eukprot:2631172-Pyramimonas_sp.AAC.1
MTAMIATSHAEEAKTADVEEPTPRGPAQRRGAGAPRPPTHCPPSWDASAACPSSRPPKSPPATASPPS